MPPFRTIRVKITDKVNFKPPLDVWFVSHAVTGPASDDKVIALLNRRAKAKGLHATYELATEEQYRAYRLERKVQAPASA